MAVKLLTEHLVEFLSQKGGSIAIGSPESTLVFQNAILLEFSFSHAWDSLFSSTKIKESQRGMILTTLFNFLKKER